MTDTATTSDLPLQGTGALVTGGGSGIGLACAKQLVTAGASVTLMGRRVDVVREAARALAPLTSPGARVTFHSGDVTDEDHVRRAAESAATVGGRLGVVVAAAGTGGGAAPVTMLDTDVWKRCLDVNLTGAFLTVKHGAAAMTDGGSIVAISSIAGVLTHRLMTAYCVSKAGLEMLVRNAADELGSAGIRVNAVRPSLVPTDLADPLAANPGIVEDYLEQMPLGRLGTVDDVADAVRYLAGPESSWVTGQIFATDGGHTLRRGPDLLRATPT